MLSLNRPARKRQRRNPDLSRYPRRGFIFWIRRMLLWCWVIIGAYASNDLANIFPLVFKLSKDHDMASAARDIIQTLVIPYTMNDAPQPTLTIALFAISLGLLLVGCIWAITDKQYERSLLQKQEKKPEEPEFSANEPPNLPLPDAPFDTGRLPAAELFVERQEHTQWLIDVLRRGGGNNPVVLYGLPGVGKTALVGRAIRQLQSEGRFRNGIIIHACRGQTDVATILRRILRRFDSQRQFGEMRDDTVDWNDIASVLLQGKDVLLVLDNVEPGVELEYLLTPLLTAKATVLITARYRFSGSGLIHKVGPLSAQEAQNLFAQSLAQSTGLPRTLLTRTQQSAAVSIVKGLGYHALAVKLAGAQAAHRDLEQLASELLDPKNAINLPEGDTPRVVALAFSESIKGLTIPAQTLFFALSAFPSSDFSRRAARSLAEKMGLDEIDFILHQLIMRALVETATIDTLPVNSDRERLRLHPLLRTFASVFFVNWPQREQDTVHQAIAQYYVDYSNNTSLHIIGADELNITGMLHWAHEHREHDLEIGLCTGMQSRWLHQSMSGGQDFLRWGVEAATIIAGRSQLNRDFQREADLRFSYAQLLELDGKVAEAESIYQANLKARRFLRDQHGENEVLIRLVQLALRRGKLSDAESYYVQSMDVTRRREDQMHRNEVAEAARLGCMSEIAWRRGRLEEAEHYSQQSQTMLQASGERRYEVLCFIRLGGIAQDRGRFQAARDYYAKGQRISRDLQDQQVESWLNRSIGGLALTRADYRRAEEHLNRALELARASKDRRVEGWVMGDLGRLAQMRKEFPQAEYYYQKAQEILGGVQDRHGEGWVLVQLGELAQESGQDGRVERFCRDALRITREGEDALSYARAAQILGTFLIVKQSNRTEGCPLLSEAAHICMRIGLPNAEQVQKTARSLRCL